MVFEIKIISGGQAGADRAALDWALARNLPHGGWCPAGRKSEDGVIDSQYRLQETESANYRIRTARNVRDSDATLILNLGELDGGSLETFRAAERQGKPVRVISLECALSDQHADELLDWLRRANVAVLNVAGPRESKRPGIYSATLAALDLIWARSE